MRVKTLIASTLALACFMPAPGEGQDWAGKGRASGTVVDPDGNAVADATVTLKPQGSDDGPDPIITNKKGRWSLLGLDGGLWIVTVTKDGYKPADGPYQVNPFNASPSLEITLAPSPFSSITIADELAAAGDHAAARAEYQKALQHLDPTAASRLKSRIGDTYMTEGNFAAAREQYNESLLGLAPEEQAHVRLQIANSHQLEGNVEEARSQYLALVPLIQGPAQAQIHLAVARTYGQQGNNTEAITSLEKAHEMAPDDVAVLQLLADLLVREGRDAEAQSYLERMPEGTKLPPDMLLNVGIQKYNEGDMDGALEYFNRTVEENDSMADAYYYRGLVHLAKGLNDEATADFERLLALNDEGKQADEAREFLEFLKSAS